MTLQKMHPARETPRCMRRQQAPLRRAFRVVVKALRSSKFCPPGGKPDRLLANCPDVQCALGLSISEDSAPSPHDPGQARPTDGLVSLDVGPEAACLLAVPGSLEAAPDRVDRLWVCPRGLPALLASGTAVVPIALFVRADGKECVRCG
jgi:hypothetical protein